MEGESAATDLVIVEWKDVVGTTSSIEMQRAIRMAYGPQGVGVLAIANIPDFVTAKEEFLPMARDLALLDPEYLEENLTDRDSLYNAGWSHGKEKIKDQPDWAKASFYYNPITDTPGTAELRKQYPLSYPANLWPDVLPEFQARGMRLGQIMTRACQQVARHLDAVAETNDLLTNALRDTDKVKARLLYYYPLQKESDDDEGDVTEDSWVRCLCCFLLWITHFEILMRLYVSWHRLDGTMTVVSLLRWRVICFGVLEVKCKKSHLTMLDCTWTATTLSRKSTFLAIAVPFS